VTHPMVSLSDLSYEPGGTRVAVEAAGECASTLVPTYGDHVATETIDHVSRRLQAGDDLASAMRSLRIADAPRRRARRLGARERIIIDDRASTTVEQLRPSLQVLAQLGRAGRQTILVLGSLRLEGEGADDPRDELGLLLVRLDIAQLVAIGADLRRLHLSAGREGSWNGESVQVDNALQAYDFVRASSEDDAVILVCGGETPELEHLVSRLCEADA